MRRVRRFQIAQYDCLVIKYTRDTRYSDTGMATHDKWVVLINPFQQRYSFIRMFVWTYLLDFFIFIDHNLPFLIKEIV